MKKTLIYTIVLLTTILSCKKDNFNQINQSNQESDINTLSSLRLNNQKIEDIITLSLNEEDERIRNLKNTIGIALRNTLINKDYVNLLIDDAKKSSLKETNFLRVLKNNPTFLVDLDRNIKKLKNKETFNSIYTQLEYFGTKLYPVIVIPNLESLNVNLMPIVASSLDVEEQTVDDILAYFILEDGTHKEIILNENEAVNLTKPVIIFSFGMNDELLNKDDLSIDFNHYYNYEEESIIRDSSFYANNSLKSGGSTFRMLNIHTSIKSPAYFYEGNGQNEYFQSTILVQSSGNGNYYLKGYYHTNDAYNINLIKRFKITECVSQQYTTWDDLVNFANTNGAPSSWSGEDKYSSRSFERDWYGGNQSLGTTSYKPLGKPTTYKHMTGKMAYPDQWYVRNTTAYGKPYSMWAYRDIQSHKSKCAQTRSN